MVVLSLAVGPDHVSIPEDHVGGLQNDSMSDMCRRRLVCVCVCVCVCVSRNLETF